jgi:hypothetical protein
MNFYFHFESILIFFLDNLTLILINNSFSLNIIFNLIIINLIIE